MSSDDAQDQRLQSLTVQIGRLVQALDRQNETTEKMWQEQIARVEEQNQRSAELDARIEKQDLRIQEQNKKIEEQSKETQQLTAAIMKLVERPASDPELVSLMRTSNKTMEEMASAMKTLEKNSTVDHDDRPLARHGIEVHEAAWRAVFETRMNNMKDQVERWRNGLDSSLIFVALFVTIITTFQSPVSQNLSPGPTDMTNAILGNLSILVYEIAILNGLKAPSRPPEPQPFAPDLTDQIVTLFWYSSLLLSLITAIVSLFGRQWIEHLTKKPDGHSYKDKSKRIDLRLRLANRLLRPVLDTLHPILILSIVLFIVGLLYQLWSISISAGKTPVLMLTSSLGSIYIIATGITSVRTFVHGVRREESPFMTGTSLTIRGLLSHSDEEGPASEEKQEGSAIGNEVSKAGMKAASSARFDQESVSQEKRDGSTSGNEVSGAGKKRAFMTTTFLTIRRFFLRSDRAVSGRDASALREVDNSSGQWALYKLFCSATQEMSETHHLEQVSSVPLVCLLKSKDVGRIRLAVDSIVFILESDASAKAKQTVAWNLCRSVWGIDETVRKQVVEYHRRLSRALKTNHEDTPPNQETLNFTFFFARMVALINFSGRVLALDNSEKIEQIYDVFSDFFYLDSENCIDWETCEEMRKYVYQCCLKWVKENYQFVGNYCSPDGLLWRILQKGRAFDDFNRLRLILDVSAAVLRFGSRLSKEKVLELLRSENWYYRGWTDENYCQEFFDALRDTETDDLKANCAITRLVVILKIGEVDVSLDSLRNEAQLLEIYRIMCKFSCGRIPDEVIRSARTEAYEKCLPLEKQYPDLFNILNDDKLLPGILKDYRIYDVNQLELFVDVVDNALRSNASFEGKETVAWKLCTTEWWVPEIIVQEKRFWEHRRLQDALCFAEESEGKTRDTYIVIRMVVLLRFSGVIFLLEDLPRFIPFFDSVNFNRDDTHLESNRGISSEKAFFEICNMNSEDCIDKDLLKELKVHVRDRCLRWDKGFSGVLGKMSDEDILQAILRGDVADSWKEWVLSRLNDDHISGLLEILSIESCKEYVNCVQLIRALSLVLRCCRIPFPFPSHFNISSLLKFAISDEHRFNDAVNPANVLLSYLSLMDDNLLNSQQDLPLFLDSLAGHEQNISSVRNEIPLMPRVVMGLCNRITLPEMPSSGSGQITSRAYEV